MAEKVNLKVMQCPSCGGALKAVNGTDEIICVWCGNSIVPVQEAPAGGQNGAAGMGGGLVKIEGMRTPASALAYAEQFFEEYDWDAFNYAQSLSVSVIDRLAASMKGSCADDKNTWILCSKAITVPFIRKVQGCQEILKILITQYEQDNLDAYSTFDAYKRVSAMIRNNKVSVLADLEKIAANAKKYGASDEELGDLSADRARLQSLPNLPEYADIKQIPEVKDIIAEQNAQVVRTLAAQGINASEAYLKAKNLIAQNNYVEAMNTLCTLKGYADTEELIDKIDKYFLISDALEIGGKLYFFRRNKSGQELNLHPTASGQILDKPILKNIKQVITNYADILYYLDKDFKLKRYNFSTNIEEKLFKKRLSDKPIYVRGYTAYLMLQVEAGQNSELVALDLMTGAVQTAIGNVKSIISFTGNKLVYSTVSKGESGGGYQQITNVVDMEAKKMVSLGSRPVTVAGFLDNYVVYTQEAPNSYNKNLFVKAIDSQEPAKLIEKNIYRFCDIISNKLFYYIGNSRNPSLISVNCDGSIRKEWPLYISHVLFARGGWLYFIRKAGYNSILCKARIDGSDFSVIAADIDEFVEIKNGYLYYINDRASLVKVRMDGSNLQKLCDDVESILSVKDDKIIFVSIDDRITVGTPPFASTRVVKSIYAVDFTGSGKSKLAYNIGIAKKYDEQTIYYLTAAEPNGEPGTTYEMLYKMDVATNKAVFLLNITRTTQKSGCYVATCVYGSYDCPQVWTLRRYRDEVLASTWYGRCFIKSYYAISPTLVSWFGDTQWFKNMWQGKLDRMVDKLQQQGVEDTPYEDKAW